MTHLKFKTNIANITDIVRCCGGLTVEVNKNDNDECNVELTSFAEHDDARYIELMSAVCLIAEKIGADEMQFIY